MRGSELLVRPQHHHIVKLTSKHMFWPKAVYTNPEWENVFSHDHLSPTMPYRFHDASLQTQTIDMQQMCAGCLR